MKQYLPSNSPFKIVYVDITHKCQMSCANCYLPNRDIPDMDLVKLYTCLEQLPKKTDIRLVGGEPTLRKDLPEIISEIIRIGHRPILITNGLKLSDKKYVNDLVSAGLNYAQISFNGYKYDEIYEKIDSMRCAVTKVKAVENCISEGLQFSLSCILVRDINTHLVDELIDFSQALPKPSRLNFRNIGAIGRNMSKIHQPLSFDEIIDLVAKKTQFSAEEIKSFKVADNQIRIPIIKNQRRSQQVILKITDWTVFQAEKMNDPKALVRGRITQDFNLAAHFEHVKANEFGY